MPRSFVVINPASGAGKTAKRWPSLLKSFEHATGRTFEHGLTSGPGDARRLVEKALTAGYDEILALGGDGTHHEAVSGFFDDDLRPLAPDATFVPLASGTGSDYVRTLRALGWYGDPLAVLTSPNRRSVSLGTYRCMAPEGEEVRGIFLNILDVGLGASVVKVVNASSKSSGGFLTFFLGCLRVLFGYRPATVQLTCDGEAHTLEQVRVVAVALGRYFGGGMHIAPSASPEGERFSTVILAGRNGWSLFNHAPDIYLGTHLRSKISRQLEGTRLLLTSAETVELEVDGEPVGRLPLEVELRPRALWLKTL
ncbi:MAG: hypothetical protein A2284_14165 [Deltaproteobacteria bacterium RIFOXYA12_FULL_61_11]|nr:MAG: hypothetical protein A2284_14165 [Deltaproteobacteria bacterium RIFOXYA12_FULL_61_11]